MTTKKSNEQMQKVEVIIHIDAPREAVWAYMARARLAVHDYGGDRRTGQRRYS